MCFTEKRFTELYYFNNVLNNNNKKKRGSGLHDWQPEFCFYVLMLMGGVVSGGLQGILKCYMSHFLSCWMRLNYSLTFVSLFF